MIWLSYYSKTGKLHINISAIRVIFQIFIFLPIFYKCYLLL